MCRESQNGGMCEGRCPDEDRGFTLYKSLSGLIIVLWFPQPDGTRAGFSHHLYT